MEQQRDRRRVELQRDRRRVEQQTDRRRVEQQRDRNQLGDDKLGSGLGWLGTLVVPDEVSPYGKEKRVV